MTSTMPSTDAEVVIVGGGLAGLAAARRLHRAGVALAAGRGRGSARRPGRHRRRRRLPARPGIPGAQHGVPAPSRAGRPRRARPVPLHARRPRASRPRACTGWSTRCAGPRPSWSRCARRSARCIDRARFAAYVGYCAAGPVDRLLSAPEVTAEQTLLQRAGLSHAFVEELAPAVPVRRVRRPVTVDLQPCAGDVRAVLRARPDRPCPAQGMGALPAGRGRAAAARPGAPVHPGGLRRARPGVACGRRVAALPGGAGGRFADRRRFAAGAHAAAHAGADDVLPRRRRGAAQGADLLLDGDRREIVANTVVISQAAPSYAPAGRHLVSTSVVGVGGHPEPVVRAELARLYGVPVADWSVLSVVAVPEALPAAPPPRVASGRRSPWARVSSWPATTATARPSRARWRAAGARPARWCARCVREALARGEWSALGRSGYDPARGAVAQWVRAGDS